MPAILVLALVIGALTCVFALQNTEVAAVSFLMWHYEASMALVLMATFALGALVGLLALIPTVVKSKWDIVERDKKLLDLEDRVAKAAPDQAATSPEPAPSPEPQTSPPPEPTEPPENPS